MADIIPNLSVSTARPSEGSSNLLLSDQTFSSKPNHPFHSYLSNPGICGRKVASNCEDILSVSMIDMDGRSVCWVYTEVTLHMQKEVFMVSCKTRKICQ